jgi:hypothetical protein
MINALATDTGRPCYAQAAARTAGASPETEIKPTIAPLERSFF